MIFGGWWPTDHSRCSENWLLCLVFTVSFYYQKLKTLEILNDISALYPELVSNPRPSAKGSHTAHSYLIAVEQSSSASKNLLSGGTATWPWWQKNSPRTEHQDGRGKKRKENTLWKHVHQNTMVGRARREFKWMCKYTNISTLKD